ncbi:hypothetical protein TSAR_002881 [Trichomalopsis sarcophagae]|uniref:Uncharacterized protein n=1 Tax=Trichomalopsis sarcophagae TaxID=543379 RepID=A0A232F271_9HYME|nr:hypothetical protein TSAR_002881 [Trichomalopsis sarcophagae]
MMSLNFATSSLTSAAKSSDYGSGCMVCPTELINRDWADCTSESALSHFGANCKGCNRAHVSCCAIFNTYRLFIENYMAGRKNLIIESSAIPAKTNSAYL